MAPATALAPLPDVLREPYGLEYIDPADVPWVLLNEDHAGVDNLRLKGVRALSVEGGVTEVKRTSFTALTAGCRLVYPLPVTDRDRTAIRTAVQHIRASSGVQPFAYGYDATKYPDPAGDHLAGMVVESPGGRLFVDAPSSAETTPSAPSWEPVDLGPVLDGTLPEVKPTMLARTDGVMMLYPGLTHSIHGESESFKSGVMQAAAVQVLDAGGRVIYVDYESDPVSVMSRLIAFGADPAVLRDPSRFVYVNPELSPLAPGERAAYDRLLSDPADLVVLDGVTDALVQFGAKSVDADEVTRWVSEVPRRIADRTGAAVALVDHVTKSHDGRGRFAIGSQAKMNTITGAAYTIEIIEPCGIGLVGRVSIRVGKDRPGAIRAKAGEFRASDRTQALAEVVVDAKTTPNRTTVTFQPPAEMAEGTAAKPWRPTVLMARVSSFTEKNPAEWFSKNGINDSVPGNKQNILQAIGLLAEGGFLEKHVSESGLDVRFKHLRRYVEAEDPHSDKFSDPQFTALDGPAEPPTNPFPAT